MKSKRKTVLIMVMALCMLLGSSMSAFAANSCPSVSGNSKFSTTVNYYAITEHNWSLTKDYVQVKQTKGIMKYNNWIRKSKTFNCYGIYRVTAVDVKTGKEVVNKKWNDKSMKIKLPNKDRRYKITIKASEKSSYQTTYIFRGYIAGWKTLGCWKATKTKGIKLCK